MGNEASQQIQYGHSLENDVKVEWKKADVSPAAGGQKFPGRDGHCACSVGGRLYVFGGVVHPQQPDEDVTESNELLVLDLGSKTWTRPDVTGSIPPPRSAATMVSIGNSIYLFGGLSRETGWFDTLHKFDTETSEWSTVECEGTPPSPRDKLASAVIGQKMYIFGGFGPSGMEEEEEELSDEDDEDDEGAQFGWFNDLFIFDTATKTWSSPMQMNLGAPTPRAAHGMCCVGKYLLIFGGRDANARRSDLHIFDTETRKWIVDLVIQGRQPDPRSFHSLTAVGSRVAVLGGRGVRDQHFQDFHIFDSENRHWIQPAVTGNLPPGCGQHTATVVGDQLVIYGGSGEFSQETLQCTKYYSDVYTVAIESIGSGSSWLPAKPSEESSSSTQDQVHTSEETAQSTDQQPIPPSLKQPNNGNETESSPAKKPRLEDEDRTTES